MDEFTYRSGSLFCEDVAVDSIAETFGTPCYVYSRATLVGHYERLVRAFASISPLICFSIKSCSNLSIIRLLAECGAGMDLVSGGELHRARLAGVDLGRCVLAGVGKSDREITEALECGVGWFNIESEGEFLAIAARSASMDCSVRAALRVNPDVDANTHRYTTTGTRRTKFGVDIDQVRAFFRRHGGDRRCTLSGLHVHLGSPIYTTEPYVRALRRVLGLIEELESDGHRIEMIDLGGGFGADYRTAQSPSAAEYAQRLVPLLEPLVDRGIQIILEPGRTISANAGILVVRVLYVKATGAKRFVICDAGMNALMRPSHYEAFHFVWPCDVHAYHVPLRRDPRLRLPDLEQVDVVGPICETGDFLALDRMLPPVDRGDLLAVFSAGAYGMTMANRYNSQPLPAEVLVDGDEVRLVRRRETYDDLVDHELGLDDDGPVSSARWRRDALVVAADAAVVLAAIADLLTLPPGRAFTAERKLMRVASLGMPHRVNLVVTNHSGRRFLIDIRDDLPEEFEFSPEHFTIRLNARSRADMHYEFRAHRRGKFALDKVHFRVRSWLGLWQRHLTHAVPSLVFVYPDMKQMSEYAVLARTNRLSLMGVRRTRKIGQDNEFERLRDYTRDDNYKHIDWRASARRNKLTVKDFQTNQSQRIMFLLDCGRMMTNEASGLSLLDHSLNAMLMLSFVALRQGDAVGLICFSDQIHNYVPPRGGMAQMNRLLHAAFDRFPRLVESRYDEAFLYLSSHCNKRSLVVLVTNLIDEVNSHQVERYLGTLVGRHLPLGVLLRDRRLFDAADAPHRSDRQLYRAAAAAEILTWRHQVLTDLEHRGVLSLDVFPEDMTAPLVNRYLEIKARHLL